MSNKFCTNCGAPIEEKYKFCQVCGTPTEIGESDTASPDMEKPKKRKSTKILVLLLIAAMIGTGGYFGYEHFRYKEAADNEGNNFFNDGLASVFNGNLYGFIDEDGNFKIDPIFEECADFSSGLCNVRIGDAWGYINAHGEFVALPQYKYEKKFNQTTEVTVVEDNEGKYLINKKNEVLKRFSADCWIGSFSENGLAAYVAHDENGDAGWGEIRGEYGFINQKGEVVIEPQYDYVEDFSENGLALAKKNNKYGYINAKNEVVIPFEYEYANSMRKNMPTLVCENDLYGYIDEQGKYLIEPAYTDASNFQYGIAVVEFEDGNWGAIDEAGKVLFKKEFSYLEDFTEDYYTGAGDGDDETVYLIDKDGNILRNMTNENVLYNTDYDENVEKVFVDDKTCLYVEYGEDWYENKYGFISPDGKTLISAKYDDGKNFTYVDEANRDGMEYAAVAIDGKWGFIDLNGKTVVPFHYDNILSSFAHGIAIAEKNEKLYILGADGKPIDSFSMRKDADSEAARATVDTYDDGYTRISIEEKKYYDDPYSYEKTREIIYKGAELFYDSDAVWKKV